MTMPDGLACGFCASSASDQQINNSDQQQPMLTTAFTLKNARFTRVKSSGRTKPMLVNQQHGHGRDAGPVNRAEAIINQRKHRQ